MTGYQLPETLQEKISQYSPIGGMAYSFIEPYVEQFVRDKMGIKNPQQFLNPAASNWSKSNAFFHNADLAKASPYVDAMRWVTSTSPSNSIMQAFAKFAAAKSEQAERVIPIFQQAMVESGVRRSFAHPGKSLLDYQNAWYTNNGQKPGYAGPSEQDVTQFFADAINVNAPGVRAGEQAELARNFIRSNFLAISGYNKRRNEFVPEGFQYTEAKESAGYKLSRDTVQKLRDQVNRVNDLRQKGDLTFSFNKDGQVVVSSNNDSDDAKNAKTAAEQELSTLNKLLKGNKNNGIKALFKDDGKLAIDTTTIDSINDTQRNFKRYGEAIKAWSEQLNTTLEQASANLNNIANMDVTSSFMHNYETLRDSAEKAKHINALMGRGNAYTQTAVHSASAVLERIGGDKAAAFSVGTQAAMLTNNRISQYRGNQAEQDTYNVAMQTGFQESDMSKRISAVFALSGYENTEEGRRQFEEDLKQNKIDPARLNMDTAIRYLKSRGKDVSQAQLQRAEEFDIAKDFRRDSTLGARTSADASMKQLTSEILNGFTNEEDRKKAEEMFKTPQGRAVFFEIFSMDPTSRQRKLSELGFSGTSATDVEGYVREQIDAGNLRHLGDWNKAMKFAAGLASRPLTEEEVQKRAEAERLLNTYSGGTAMQQMNNALTDRGGDKKSRDLIMSLFQGTSVGGTMAALVEKGKRTKEEIDRDAERVIRNQSAVDAYIEGNKDISMSGDEMRQRAKERYMHLIRSGASEEELAQARSDLDRLTGVSGGTYDDSGNLTNYKGTEGYANAKSANASLKDIAKRLKGPFVSDEVRALFTGQNKDIQSGTKAEQELLVARTAAIEEFRSTERDLNKLNSKNESDLTQEEKDRKAELSRKKATLSKNLTSLGLEQKDGKIVVTKKDADASEYSEGVENAKKTLSPAMARASQKLGIQPMSETNDLLTQILKAIQGLKWWG